MLLFMVLADASQVPPYAVSTVFSLLGALLADRYRARGLVTIFFSVVAVAGYATFLGQ
jgi:hypothetical protein